MSAQASFEVCGMMILTAGAMGLDAVDRLSDFASQVKPEAVDPAARPLFSAIVRNLELGRPPTEANLLDADGSISGRALAAAKDAASQQQGRGKLEAAIAALNSEYTRRENHKWLTAALEANQKGEQSLLSGISVQTGLARPF